MCDYSAHGAKTRDQKGQAGDQLITTKITGHTYGFVERGASGSGAVCLLPGTRGIATLPRDIALKYGVPEVARVTFKQVNLDQLYTFHDGLQFDEVDRFYLLQSLGNGVQLSVEYVPLPLGTPVGKPKVTVEQARASAQREAAFI